MTENSGANWGAAADEATASVYDDTSRVKVGSRSIRLETTAPFDCRMWYPAAQNAHWDLLASGGPTFWVYADNPNAYGFQNNSPWVRLASGPNDYIDYRTTYDPLNSAIGNWLQVVIPLTGDATWHRAITGSPDLRDVAYVEIHTDTWGAGFTVWLDGFGFTTPLAPPQDQAAVALNHAVALSWRAYEIDEQFDHYAIYRSTSAFSSVADMTPIATVAGINSTQYTDTTALNGTRYHYAVTTLFTGGGQTTQVTSIGPRTPRDETDLQVVSISRTPRFPRYDPLYTYYEITEPSGFGPYVFSAATGLGSGQTGSTQRWPIADDPITYTATVRNRGTNAWSGTLTAEWRVDNVVVSSPAQIVTLAPGATTTFALVRFWDTLSHEIRFSLNLSDARGGNNTLAVDTKSVAFLSYVDVSRIENFREETPGYPGAATDDFLDWLNRHMQRFNQMFAEANCGKRIHFDVLEVLADTAPDPNVNRILFAIFPFRYYAHEGTLRQSGYYDATEDLDYGLLHEMGHQLGLIDLYRLDVSSGANQVSGLGYSGPAGLMHGVSHFLSQNSAYAMTHWLDTAHGYYGQYLYHLPAEIRMRFLASDGRPLANATATVYQKCERPGQGEVITNQAKVQGVTDSAGEYLLPNVPINSTLVPPAYNGDRLRDNPFGYLAVVGTNGVLLLKIEYDGATDFAWLDVTEANNAYWEGQTASAVFERSTSLGGPIQRIPPADMAESNANDWSAWAEGSDPQNTYVTDDGSRRLVGRASVRFVTNGGFDTYVRYPRTFNARWDLTCAQVLHISFYAENPNSPGFQSGSPWIRLRDRQNDYVQFQYYSDGYPYDLLNQARNQWRQYDIPLDAPTNTQTGWRRTLVGTPDLAQIQYLEIHADTWGGGFTLWLDGVGFDRVGLPADFDHTCGVGWADLDVFAACAVGPGIPYQPENLPAGCTLIPDTLGFIPADLDRDRDVDAMDFAEFQREWTGEGP
ncbi:MAG: hypothetical protein HY718_04815 [Planctomycetes bacterium]|nr:hypothetical protein [Planctomycetota bacterium]